MRGIEKVATGIPGLDYICHGGFPANRLTLVSGTSGTGKTILAAQFLIEAIAADATPGVMVSFEESAEDLRRSLTALGWDVRRYEEDGLLYFVDASTADEYEIVPTGDFDLTALIVRIEHAVSRIGARRVALDSMATLFLQLQDTTLVRRELLRVSTAMKRLGTTTVMTAERLEDYGAVSRFGVEEFVADNVLILRNVLQSEKRRRTIEVFKARGTDHHQGEVPVAIVSERGIVVLPLGEIELGQASTETRVSSGNAELDAMCGGGFFQDSVILVTGATGTGKTLLTTEFVAGGVARGEPTLLFCFEESPDQLIRNARGWGYDFPAMTESGLFRFDCRYPETAGLEDHLYRIRAAVEEMRPRRVAVDSITALKRIAGQQGFREFLLNLTAFLKKHQVTGLVTSTAATLAGAISATDSNISTLTDTIILLRYFELHGHVRRGMTVLKMRGSAHDKTIREFHIDGDGLRVGEPLTHVRGILRGTPEPVIAEDR